MNRSRVIAIQTVLLFVAILMIAYGFFRGEAAVILNKAINICLECIGLG